MSQWTSVCTHAHTDYGLSSTARIVEYAVKGNPARPCVHYALVPKDAVGSPNVTRLRELARSYPAACSVKVYDVKEEEEMRRVVEEITEECGDSGVNLVYTCPDWCEEDAESQLEDVTEEVLARTFHHNCVVPVLLSKLFYPALQRASHANSSQTLNRRRAAIVHMISEAGTLGDHFPGTRGHMYAYSASLAAMIMSMRTMSYEFNKRKDGILAFAVITDTPHVTRQKLAECQQDSDVTGEKYDVTMTRDLIAKVVHSAGEAEHGKCLYFRDGKDVSY